jgi:primosomal protein N' (replication factor Y)
MNYADVILPLPLDGMFTYSIPAHMQESMQVGMRVRVPFGKSKTYIAIVAHLHNERPSSYQVKDILELIDQQPVLLPQQLKQWQWISNYYMSPIGEVYKAALPGGMKAEDGYKARTELYITLAPPFQSEQGRHIALEMLRKAQRQLEVMHVYLEMTANGEEVTRESLLNSSHNTLATINALIKRGILTTYEREVARLNHGGEPHPEHIKQLNEAQQDAFNQIQFQFLKKQVVLLHGVTSSGKTEIYIHLIQQALERKQQVLYLVPEIALTVQMMNRLRKVFGNQLGIYHSKYSDAERVEIWQKQLSDNPYDIILGARSAVFLPFQRLGLVIVDEEHETSYKQQDPMPRYHARDVAIMMAAPIREARVLLGTATPSMESYYNTQTGKYGLVELKQRYQGIELPEIQIVDTKALQHRKLMNGPFSPILLSRVREALEHGEQAILFQNRRGYSPMVECRQCGWVPRCQHCDVSLTLHRNTNELVCHYCGATYSIPTSCPSCESKELQARGFGTEKIEDAILAIFPEARVARMDLDTTRSRNAYERIIDDFAAGRTNILIGTQMISKGLDFDRVSVVGILNADTMLNYPDFRAYEHAFMMMAQVSGRAGRKGKRGLVILQTKQPDLPLIHQVVRNDYVSFYNSQVLERREFHYPPFYRLINIYLRHKDNDLVETAANVLGNRLRQWFGIRLLGPDRPSIAKVKQQNIRKLVLKLENGIDIKKVREYLLLAQSQLLADRRYTSIQMYFDADPV